MKTIIAFVFCVGLFQGLYGQSPDTVYTYIDSMPEFKGGDMQLMKFLRDSIIYPAGQWDSIPWGKVIVRFVVNEDGNLSDFRIIRSLQLRFDKEVLRVVKNMPPFKPGVKNGKPVKVYYTLPVHFGK